MTIHKYTDEEVIKSLKVCLEGDNCKECYINPHHGNYGYCTSLALKAALDLINRQKAEIERLTVELDAMRGAANSFKIHYNNAKAEAIKEFVELLECVEEVVISLNNGEAITAVDTFHIHRIAKKMIGETK